MANFPVILGSALLHTVFYLLSPALSPKVSRSYGRLKPDQRIHWDARVVSMVHVIVCLQGALRGLLSFEESDNRMWGSTELADFYVAYSTGYFLWDAVACVVRPKLFGTAMIIHGLGCLVTYFLCNHFHFILYYACFFLLWETSTPFVNVRGFLYDTNLRDSKLYLLNGLAMLVTFFIVRIVFGFYMSYDLWNQFIPANDDGSLVYLWLVRYCKFFNITMNCINSFWMYKMVIGAMRALQGKHSE